MLHATIILIEYKQYEWSSQYSEKKQQLGQISDNCVMQSKPQKQFQTLW